MIPMAPPIPLAAFLPLAAVAPATLLAIVWTALILPQAVLTLWFALIVRHRTRAFLARTAARPESATIPAEVILCLRGCDATLDDVFAALARQSHRAWRLRVVVDAETDPAWEAAHAAVGRLAATASPSWTAAVIEPLAGRPLRGSLKCAALRQALRSLAPDTRVVALVDADSVVHHDWLLTMVDECQRPGVGAVSGNRWYDPDRDTPAAVVRALWNAGAIVQMTTFGIPWGGSLAVRREALDDCRWADAIEGTLCEDTALAAPLARAGWAYRFVPALVAIDRDDDVALGPLTRWIARQLLTARLHHPAWPLVAAHGIATSAVLAVAAAGWLGASLMGRAAIAAPLGTFLAAYEGATLGLFLIIAASIQAAVAVTGRRPHGLSPPRAAWWIFLIPATQVVYGLAIARSLVARSVEWRGIVYDIRASGTGAEVAIRPPSLAAPALLPTE
jgi:hypothetical protein